MFDGISKQHPTTTMTMNSNNNDNSNNDNSNNNDSSNNNDNSDNNNNNDNCNNNDNNDNDSCRTAIVRTKTGRESRRTVPLLFTCRLLFFNHINKHARDKCFGHFHNHFLSF